MDTSATHNFMSEGEAKKSGLKTEKDSSRIKAVNFETRQIAGAAKDVSITLRTWNGRTNFMVIPLDDFQIILGMGFLQVEKVMLMPQFRSVYLFGGEPPHGADHLERQGTSRASLSSTSEEGFEEWRGRIPSHPMYGRSGCNWFPNAAPH